MTHVNSRVIEPINQGIILYNYVHTIPGVRATNGVFDVVSGIDNMIAGGVVAGSGATATVTLPVFGKIAGTAATLLGTAQVVYGFYEFNSGMIDFAKGVKGEGNSPINPLPLLQHEVIELPKYEVTEKPLQDNENRKPPSNSDESIISLIQALHRPQISSRERFDNNAFGYITNNFLYKISDPVGAANQAAVAAGHMSALQAGALQHAEELRQRKLESSF